MTEYQILFLLKIIIIFLISNTNSESSFFIFNIEPTSEFKNLYLQKINSNQIYIGNEIIEGIYDIKENKYIKTIIPNSIFYQRMQSPKILFSNLNEPKYIVSIDALGKKLRIIDINNNQIKNLEPFCQSVALEEFLFNVIQLSENLFLVLSRTQRIKILGGGNIFMRMINIEKGKMIREDIQLFKWQGGLIYLEDNINSPILEFNVDSGKISAYFFDLLLNNIKTSKDIIQRKNENGFFQSIEIGNHIIITCYILEEGNSKIECFTGKYDTNGFYLNTNWKEIINFCPLKNYYSLYKFNYERGIITCYSNNQLELFLIDSSLNYIKIIISGDNFIFGDFIRIDESKILIAIARKNLELKIEYIGILYSCPIETTISNKELTFISYDKNIKILNLPKNGFLYQVNYYYDKKFYKIENKITSIGEIYNLNTLIYKTDKSNIVDSFQYKNNDITYDNGKIKLESECDMEIIICHKYCNSCLKIGDSKNENCLTCKEGYFMNPYIKGNCIPNCNNAWYYDEQYKFHCLNYKNSCGNDNMFFIEANKQCVTSCKNDNHLCIFCQKHDLYEYKNLCLLGCVTGTIRNEGKCIISNENDEDPPIDNISDLIEEEDINDNNNDDYIIVNDNNNNNILINDILDKINDNDDILSNNPLTQIYQGPNNEGISSIFKSSLNQKNFLNNINEMAQICFNELNREGDSKKSIASIISSKCKYDYYSTDISLNDRKKANISYVDLGECENKLRVYYNIPNEEKIYIGQNKCFEHVDYKVYNSKNEELDISICKDINIKITTPIDFSNPKIQLLLAIEMNEIGIDIYNKDEEIFNNKCTQLSLNGKDLSLEVRQNDIYRNISEFCSENCIPKVDLENYEIECNCSVIKTNDDNNKNDDNLNSILEENEYFNMVNDIFSNTNIYLFKCINLLKKIRNIKALFKNIGFLISFFIVFFEFISSGFFFFKYINYILSTIFRNYNISSPIRNNNFESNIYNLNDNNPNKQNNKNSLFMCDENIEDSNSSSKRIIKFEKKISKTFNAKEKKKIENIKKENDFSNYELNELSNFDDILDLDKRTFGSYFFSIFIEKQIFLSTIFNNSLFNPLSFRLVLLFFTLHCFLFLNGLFFTEEYLNKRYKSNKLDFVYILKNEITKSIYSSIVVMIIGKILNIFTTITISFSNITKNTNDKKFSIRMKNFIFEIKKKFVLIILFILISSLLFWYFLFIFCFIYLNNVISWIESTAISIILNIIFPLIICIIISSLRFLAIKLKSQLIFEISYMFYTII